MVASFTQSSQPSTYRAQFCIACAALLAFGGMMWGMLCLMFLFCFSMGCFMAFGQCRIRRNGAHVANSGLEPQVTYYPSFNYDSKSVRFEGGSSDRTDWRVIKPFQFISVHRKKVVVQADSLHCPNFHFLFIFHLKFLPCDFGMPRTFPLTSLSSRGLSDNDLS